MWPAVSRALPPGPPGLGLSRTRRRRALQRRCSQRVARPTGLLAPRAAQQIEEVASLLGQAWQMLDRLVADVRQERRHPELLPGAGADAPPPPRREGDLVRPAAPHQDVSADQELFVATAFRSTQEEPAILGRSPRVTAQVPLQTAPLESSYDNDIGEKPVELPHSQVHAGPARALGGAALHDAGGDTSVEVQVAAMGNDGDQEMALRLGPNTALGRLVQEWCARHAVSIELAKPPFAHTQGPEVSVMQANQIKLWRPAPRTQ